MTVFPRRTGAAGPPSLRRGGPSPARRRAMRDALEFSWRALRNDPAVEIHQRLGRGGPLRAAERGHPLRLLEHPREHVLPAASKVRLGPPSPRQLGEHPRVGPTSSSPSIISSMPSKSPPIPTWSTLAIRRMSSMWSAASVAARGRMLGFDYRTPASLAPGRGGICSGGRPGHASPRSSRRSILRAGRSTDTTVATPPFAGSRRRIESGTFRGWSIIARAADGSR